MKTRIQVEGSLVNLAQRIVEGVDDRLTMLATVGVGLLVGVLVTAMFAPGKHSGGKSSGGHVFAGLVAGIIAMGACWYWILLR